MTLILFTQFRMISLMLIRRKISCKNNIHISIVSHFMYEYDAKCFLLLSVRMCLCCCGFLSVFTKFPMALWCIVVHLIDSNSLGSFALLIQSTQSRKEKKNKILFTFIFHFQLDTALDSFYLYFSRSFSLFTDSNACMRFTFDDTYVLFIIPFSV